MSIQYIQTIYNCIPTEKTNKWIRLIEKQGQWEVTCGRHWIKLIPVTLLGWSYWRKVQCISQKRLLCFASAVQEYTAHLDVEELYFHKVKAYISTPIYNVRQIAQMKHSCVDLCLWERWQTLARLRKSNSGCFFFFLQLNMGLLHVNPTSLPWNVLFVSVTNRTSGNAPF